MAGKIAAAMAAVITLGLLGCASPEEMRTEDQAACAGYGYPRGTIHFANCMQRESLARRYGPWVGPPSFDFSWYDEHWSPPHPPLDAR